LSFNISKLFIFPGFSYTKLDENDIERINAVKSFSICQKTPIRVLHRRSLLNRERQIYSIFAEYIDEYHFSITLTTQAGTYIKEFVHGDYGRTEPSICTILNKDCDILELDVLAVNLDFPPKISTN
jgi:tRNA pseudouridine synthase 10